ncbi:hypothetical protein L484_024926 [Morus notabilis]|uniref:Uncharacterized protein n=1 Tax=Morus notabilis TaxID=981085 RepID=W9RDY5_9ROSA|nr:hypothetical protein L484_024926 [Morus notabilis]
MIIGFNGSSCDLLADIVFGYSFEHSRGPGRIRMTLVARVWFLQLVDIRWCCLDDDNASVVTAEDVRAWQTQYGNPEHVELWASDGNERVDEPRDYWFALYEIFLMADLKFSLPRLASKVLSYFEIVIRQLMPNSNSDSLGRYMLVARKKNKLDFREVQNLDHEWKTKFVMAHGLIDDPDYLRSSPFVWDRRIAKTKKADMSKDELAARIKRGKSSAMRGKNVSSASETPSFGYPITFSISERTPCVKEEGQIFLRDHQLVMVIAARYPAVALHNEHDKLKDLLIKEKDNARTRDVEIKDLWACLDSAKKQIAVKDSRIQEMTEYDDERYTDGYYRAQLELLRLFRDDQQEKKGLKAKSWRQLRTWIRWRMPILR